MYYTRKEIRRNNLPANVFDNDKAILINDPIKLIERKGIYLNLFLYQKIYISLYLFILLT